MKNQICSFKHFNRLIKQFYKVSLNQYYKNSHIKYDLKNLFLQNRILFITYLRYLERQFKKNPFKTSSSFRFKLSKEQDFYVSYTFENELGRRILGNK